MMILVLNSGSLSLKAGLFDSTTSRWLFDERIEHPSDARATMQTIQRLLAQAGVDQPDAIGHRVVAGRDDARDSERITAELLATIERASTLAPLHDPVALALIKESMAQWHEAQQVAVFDSAFHHTIAEHVRLCAVPCAWRGVGVRLHGFHGLSHQSVAREVAAAMKRPIAQLRLVSCYLGSSSSVCAVDAGRSVDTSMSVTLLSGGLAALSGSDGDMRTVLAAATGGDRHAQQALQAYAHAIRHYVGAYTVEMGGIDALAFTGGIGEHASQVRDLVVGSLGYVGLAIDSEANARVDTASSPITAISASDSLPVWVVACGEQALIAEITARQLSQEAAQPATHRRARKQTAPLMIPVAVSARHVHLDMVSVQALFGPHHSLHVRAPLSQPGQWCATDTVELIGPRGSLAKVHVLGPCRSRNQIEISQTDARLLGIDPPVRVSGTADATATLTLRGPHGSVRSDGVILAHRHIHTNPSGAAAMGVHDGDRVHVEVRSRDRSMVFEDVLVRVDRSFVTEMHLDTDEGNAAGIVRHAVGTVRRVRTPLNARIVAANPEAPATGV